MEFQTDILNLKNFQVVQWLAYDLQAAIWLAESAI